MEEGNPDSPEKEKNLGNKARTSHRLYSHITVKSAIEPRSISGKRVLFNQIRPHPTLAKYESLPRVRDISIALYISSKLCKLNN